MFPIHVIQRFIQFKFCFKFIFMVLLTQWFHWITLVVTGPQKHVNIPPGPQTRTLKMDCVCVKDFSAYPLPAISVWARSCSRFLPAKRVFFSPSPLKAPPLHTAHTAQQLCFYCSCVICHRKDHFVDSCLTFRCKLQQIQSELPLRVTLPSNSRVFALRAQAVR